MRVLIVSQSLAIAGARSHARLSVARGGRVRTPPRPPI